MDNYRLEMLGMVKTFPGVLALDQVNLRVKQASVHALIGENGAGKSTLMKCLFGMYKPEKGEIKIDGEVVKINDTLEALNLGIAMIHQELNPIPYRTVADNIWVGRYFKKGIMVDEKRLYNETKSLLDELEFEIDPNALMKDLSVSELQAVEIAKALSYDARLIIMDEPTSSLTVGETKHLFKLISKLRGSGVAIIYISHKLEEMFEVADEVTVMRDGQSVGTWAMEDTTIDQLINHMVGRSLDKRFPPRESKPGNECMLQIKNFTSKNPRSFKQINFDLFVGEILGIGGLVGAQRTELIESIFGLRPIAEGSLFKQGKEIKIHTPHDAIKNRFALLTEERRTTGIIPMLSVEENALIASYRNYAKPPFGIIKGHVSKQAAKDICGKMQVKTASMDTLIKYLSGGNQQKVLIGRWLLSHCDVFILDEPTRGIDVGAKYEIYKIMRELAKEGKSIIMVSSEMPELLGMSDRILVMCNGRITGVLDGQETSQVEVMRLATHYQPNLAQENAIQNGGPQ